MGLGAGLAAVGSAVSFGAATGITAAVIGGAVVGAAVGALTAAVTSGDIGKGLLFGAIGGAVVGGISGAVGGVGSAVSGSTVNLGTGVVGVSSEGAYAAAGDAFMAGATEGISTTGVAGGLTAEIGVGTLGSMTTLESLGATVGVSALTEGVKGYLMAGAQEDSLEAAEKARKEEMDKYLELQTMKGEQSMEQIKYQRDNASAAETMANEARLAELSNRKAEFEQTLGFQREQYDATQEAKAERQALFGASTRRGGTVGDGTNVGIYQELQSQPQGALMNPLEEERKVA